LVAKSMPATNSAMFSLSLGSVEASVRLSVCATLDMRFAPSSAASTPVETQTAAIAKTPRGKRLTAMLNLVLLVSLRLLFGLARV
jgi:hypothetical protein